MQRSEVNILPGKKNIVTGLFLFFIISGGVYFLFRMVSFLGVGYLQSLGYFRIVVNLVLLFVMFGGLYLFGNGVRTLQREGILNVGVRKLSLGILMGMLYLVIPLVWRSLTVALQPGVVFFQAIETLWIILLILMYIYWAWAFGEMKAVQGQDSKAERAIGILQCVSRWMIGLSVVSLLVQLSAIFIFIDMEPQVLRYYSLVSGGWGLIDRIGYILVGVYSMKSWMTLLSSKVGHEKRYNSMC